MKLIDMVLSVDGIGYIGKLQTFTPPVIEEVVEEYTGGGLGGTIEVPMDRVGIVESTWVVSTHELSLTNVIMKNDVPVSIRGYAVDITGARVPVKYEMRGRVTRYDEGDATPAGENTVTQRMAVMKYTKTVNNEEAIHFDNLARVLRFGGIDIWEDVRRALGI